MSFEDSVPFIGKVRSTGQKQTSLIITVNKDVVELLQLKVGDLVECRIKKAKVIK